MDINIKNKDGTIIEVTEVEKTPEKNLFKIKICEKCKEEVLSCDDGDGSGEKNCDFCATANKEACSRRKEQWRWGIKSKVFEGTCEKCQAESF